MIEPLLRALKRVTESITGNMLLTVNPDTGWYEETAALPMEPKPEDQENLPSPWEAPEDEAHGIWEDSLDPTAHETQKKRPPKVFLMNTPDRSDTTSEIPYILIQFLNGRDKRETAENGRDKQSTVDVRFLIATYNTDGEEGGFQVIDILERIRSVLQMGEMLEHNYTLQSPLDYEVYPDYTGRYFLGEMDTTWSIPTVERTCGTIEEALNAGEYHPEDSIQKKTPKDIWEDETIWN